MTKARIRLATTETPERVHGRLLESVHLSCYTFARACDELKWLLRQDRWKLVEPGYDDINTFLASMDFSDLRASREERKDIVRQLAAIQAGQRATARLLGVSQDTIRHDLDLTERTRSDKPADIQPINPDTHDTLTIAERNRSLPPGPPPYYSEAGITIYHGDDDNPEFAYLSSYV